MEQQLFTELRPLYESRKDSPRVIRIKIRMSDSIEPSSFRYAVNTTMKRYSYNCVCMLREQTTKDNVLKGVASQARVYNLILSKETDEERIELVDAFMKELEDNGIGYELREASVLKLPGIRLPWTE